MSTQQFKMIASKFKDSDGFVLQFEENCPEADKKFYIKEFPTVDLIASKKPHCTTCGVHIGTSPIAEKVIRTHAILGVTQCVKCYTFYNSGEFGKGEDGSEYYCRWCGQGGEVVCCSTCPYVFCDKCINSNMSVKYVKELEDNDDWSCFVCDKDVLRKHRSEHWALRNFMIKQLEKIQKATVTSEDELNNLLNKDVSTCCLRKKKVIPVRAVIPTQIAPKLPTQAPQVKRPATSNIASFQPPAKKHQHVTYNATTSQNSSSSRRSSTSSNGAKNKNNDEIVCTPDTSFLMDMLGVGSGSEEESIPPPQLIQPTPPPLSRLPSRQRSINNNNSKNNNSNNSIPNPIFHNINGYTIDLNHASRQEVFRLPNGKLIQVRKNNPNPGFGQTSAPSVPPLQVAAQQKRTVIYPPNQMTSAIAASIRNRVPPRVIHPPPPQPQHTIIRSPNGTNAYMMRQQVRPQQTLQQLMMNDNLRVRFPMQQPGTSSFGQLNSNMNLSPMRPPMRPPMNAPRPTMTSNQQSSVFTQKDGSIAVARALHPKTPFGDAKVEFEDRIISALEICQHTINKMITLTNSTSFKESRSFKDLKDLYTHLQYLFTYTTGKLTTFNESLKTSIENVEKLDPSIKEKTEKDELEIVDDKVEVVDVLSDDEDEKPVEKSQTIETENEIENEEVEKTPKIVPPSINQTPLPPVIFKNIHQKDVPVINEDDLKIEAVKNFVDKDKRLKNQIVVKIEKLDDSKNPIIQKYLTKIQERQKAAENSENEGENDNNENNETSKVIDSNLDVQNEENSTEKSNQGDSEEVTQSVKEDESTVTETETKEQLTCSADVVDLSSDDEDAEKQPEKPVTPKSNDEQEFEENEVIFQDETSKPQSDEEQFVTEDNINESSPISVPPIESMEVDDPEIEKQNENSNSVDPMEMDGDPLETETSNIEALDEETKDDDELFTVDYSNELSNTDVTTPQEEKEKEEKTPIIATPNEDEPNGKEPMDPVVLDDILKGLNGITDQEKNAASAKKLSLSINDLL